MAATRVLERRPLAGWCVKGSGIRSRTGSRGGWIGRTGEEAIAAAWAVDIGVVGRDRCGEGRIWGGRLTAEPRAPRGWW